VWKNWDRTEFEENRYRTLGIAGVVLKRDEIDRAHRTATRGLEDIDDILFLVGEPRRRSSSAARPGTSEIVRRPTICAEIMAAGGRASTARSRRSSGVPGRPRRREDRLGGIASR
jgi:hypothetical protein